jgi:hypothetical protein
MYRDWATRPSDLQLQLSVSPASKACSRFATVNRETPQFKQTKSVGNTNTPGIGKVFDAGEMDHHLGGKFRLADRCA